MIDTKAVYDNYRASIRAQRKSSGGAGRTGNRKQVALKATADRYFIPISQVKGIVREGDLANGIIHEYTEPYKRELAFKASMDAAVLRIGDVPCSCCGTSAKSDVVRPRLATKLDVSEYHMERLLQFFGITAPRFQGVPQSEAFVQLCYNCKLVNLGVSRERLTPLEK